MDGGGFVPFPVFVLHEVRFDLRSLKALRSALLADASLQVLQARIDYEWNRVEAVVADGAPVAPLYSLAPDREMLLVRSAADAAVAADPLAGVINK